MGNVPRDSRRRILDAALRLFGQRGYGGTALQAVADELGLTKASVYYHFPAKSDLLSALAETCLERLEVGLTDAPDPSGPAGCRVLLGAYLATLADCSVVTALLIGDPTVSTHPAAIQCRSQRRRLRQMLAQAGDPPVGDVRATCSIGAVQSAVFELPRVDSTATRSVILDAAVRALGGQPDPGRRRG